MDRVLGPAQAQLESGMPRKFLATGHYARVDWMSGGRTKLMRSADWTKDQTYYLSSVPEAQLSRVSHRVTTRSKDLQESHVSYRSLLFCGSSGPVSPRQLEKDTSARVG
jgi:tRNA U34 2-thiouridine synthase MnmA/TrmU